MQELEEERVVIRFLDEIRSTERTRTSVTSVFSVRHVFFIDIPFFLTYCHPFLDTKEMEAWWFKYWLYLLEAVLF